MCSKLRKKIVKVGPRKKVRASARCTHARMGGGICLSFLLDHPTLSFPHAGPSKVDRTDVKLKWQKQLRREMDLFFAQMRKQKSNGFGSFCGLNWQRWAEEKELAATAVQRRGQSLPAATVTPKNRETQKDWHKERHKRYRGKIHAKKLTKWEKGGTLAEIEKD